MERSEEYENLCCSNGGNLVRLSCDVNRRKKGGGKTDVIGGISKNKIKKNTSAFASKITLMHSATERHML